MITGTGPETLPDTTEDAIWHHVLDSNSPSALSIFHVSGTEYVRILSSINIIQNQKLASRPPSHLAEYAENSRDPPTL